MKVSGDDFEEIYSDLILKDDDLIFALDLLLAIQAVLCSGNNIGPFLPLFFVKNSVALGNANHFLKFFHFIKRIIDVHFPWH